VKKLMVGILIFQFLIPVSIKKELLKLPSLLKHYSHHNHHHSHHHDHEHRGSLDTHDNMNLAVFFKVHYGEAAVRHSEKGHDELPFKNTPDKRTKQSTIQLFVIEPKVFEIRQTTVSESKQTIAYCSFLESNYLQSIWQPPKIS
jgi:hypothetical protein